MLNLAAHSWRLPVGWRPWGLQRSDRAAAARCTPAEPMSACAASAGEGLQGLTRA